MKALFVILSVVRLTVIVMVKLRGDQKLPRHSQKPFPLFKLALSLMSRYRDIEAVFKRCTIKGWRCNAEQRRFSASLWSGTMDKFHVVGFLAEN